MRPLLVVDAPSLMYRAFFALPDSIKGTDGRPVNALLGCANLVLREVEDHDPRAVVLCFGAEAAKYRKQLYEPYHADRPEILGGMIRLAEQLPGRDELADFANWRVAECERQGVTVELGVAADADTVLALEPDAVVVATGGRPTLSGSSYFHPMPIAGSEQDFVFDHITALQLALSADADRLGHRVVILDGVGHIEAIGIAELLAGQGHEVHLVTSLPSPIALNFETSAVAIPPR